MSPADGLAQGGGRVAPPESVRLPPAFARFSAADMLGRIFEGYDHSTGRAADILNGERKPAVVKTVSTLTTMPAGRRFYDLLVSKAVFRCSDRDEDRDCDQRSEAVRRAGSRRELWRFNGERYERAGKADGDAGLGQRR